MAEPPALLQRDGIGIHQRRKFMELRNEYTLVDATGETVGTASQERQGWTAVLLRIFSDLDVVLPMELEVRDTAGQVQVAIEKPWFTWTVSVSTPTGGHLGRISKQIRLGKARFTLEGPSGETVGEVRAQNWRARDFSVLDASGSQVANVTKKWRGLLTEAFSDADSYAVEFTPGLTEPLRTLAFASALAVDIVMKQKDA